MKNTYTNPIFGCLPDECCNRKARRAAGRAVANAAQRLTKKLYGKSKNTIFPENEREWDMLSKKMNRDMRQAIHRYNAVRDYRNYLANNFTRRYAETMVAAGKHTRNTLRDWDRRLEQYGELGMFADSRARKTPQKRDARTPEAYEFVLNIRLKRTEGKDILCERMRDKFNISASSISRILRDLFAQEKIARSLKRCSYKKKRAQQRSSAVRIKHRPEVTGPGWLQMDHKQVRKNGNTLIVFAAIDVFTRETFTLVTSRATADAALRAVAHFRSIASYRITDIQTDNGSEFRGVFENALRALGIRHHLIPVRSPTWNCLVENWFGFLTRSGLNIEDDWEATVDGLRQLVDEMVAYYNDKPNKGLAYICPETGKQRLDNPNNMRYTHTLPSGR